MEQEQAIIRMVFGKRGSGKTTKARELTADVPRVVYFDTLGHDYSDGVVCYSLAELRTFWRLVYRNRFRLIYRPSDPQAEFPAVCSLVQACEDMWFVVEETDLFFTAGGDCCDAFKNLIVRGRHAGVDMVCVTQRPKGFGRLLTSMTDDFHLFATREPDDLDYFKKRLSEEVANRLPTLQKFECLHVNDYTLSEPVV